MSSSKVGVVARSSGGYSKAIADLYAGRGAVLSVQRTAAVAGGVVAGVASLMMAGTALAQTQEPQAASTQTRQQAATQPRTARTPRAPARRAARQQEAVEAQAQAGTEALPTIDVQGAGTDGYQADRVSLTRLATPIRDTPQTINVVTEQVLRDQQTTTVVDALRNVPGLTFNAGEGGTQGDNINIRGYTARNDFYRDGVRDPGWYTRDAFSIQQVEVLKGPSSFLFGRGSTGGVVNITSKLPEFTFKNDIEAAVNTVGGYRTVVDSQGFKDDVAGRIVVLGTQSDVPGRNGPDVNRVGVAPSVAWKIAPDTKITAAYIYQRDENTPDYGIPALQNSFFGSTYQQITPVARDTFYQRLSGALRDTEQVDVHIGTFKVEHDFDNDTKLTNVTRATNVDRFTRVRAVQPNYTTTPNVFPSATGGVAFSPTNPIRPGTPLTSLFVANTNDFQINTINQLVTNQTDLVSRFSTWSFQHTFVAGLELSGETRESIRTNITGADRVNLGNPNPFPASVGVLAPTTALTVGRSTTQGIYASDQIKLNEYLELLGGLRFDHFRGEQKVDTLNTAGMTFNTIGNGTTPGFLSSDNTFLTYRAGVVLHPAQWMSVYYMHGTSANPVAEFVTLTSGQQSLDPVQNETDEIGFKADVLDGRGTFSTAVFRTEQKNAYENLGTAAVPDFRGVGTTRVQGFEVGFTGRITPEWNLTFGYTYLDSRVTATTVAGSLGNRLANTPYNSGSVFTTYAITREWTVGGGVFAQDSRFNNSANTVFVPSFVRYDAMTSYQVTKDLLLQLNIYNLADTINFTSIAGAGWAVPDVGRYAQLVARYKW